VGTVPTAHKEDYIANARNAWALFEKHGALETRQCWGGEVPDGK
jgi:uncharacterized protein YbaA (DUF1428 family)